LTLNPPENLHALRRGLMVDFRLVVNGEVATAENVHLHPYINFDFDPQSAARLEVLKKILPNEPRTPAGIEIGQHVPDFSLTDQFGRTVALSQFSGKIVMTTFVYTTCPFPNYCFRLSNNFGQLQKRFEKRMGEDLILLSITLDPRLDQPATLAKYARVWRANGTWWRFLTGPPAEIEKIKAMFGVVSSPNMEMLSHSLHTIIIDRKGNLSVDLEGNEFTSRQLGDLVEAEMDRPLTSTQSE
jgi:protein SCO1/2